MTKVLSLLALVVLFIAPAAMADCTTNTLTFLTESLSDFTLGEPAHFDIEGIGGTPPYTFEIYDGAFPAGLHMNSKGKIRGNPTELADTTVWVRLTDSEGCTLVQAFAVRVNP